MGGTKNSVESTMSKGLHPNAEAAAQRCSLEKVFWKYAANLQENTHAEVRTTLLQSNLIEVTLRYGYSPVNLQTPFLKNTSGWRHLQMELLLISAILDASLSEISSANLFHFNLIYKRYLIYKICYQLTPIYKKSTKKHARTPFWKL